MKKLLVILSLSLVLVGCGNKTTNVSNSSDVLIKVGNQSITVGQVYSQMMATDSTAIIKQMASRIIFDKEVPMDDALKAEADTQLQEFIDSVGENLDVYLQYYGYKDKDDYYNNGIIPSLQQEKLVRNYLTENFDAVAAGYRPKKIRLIEITDATLAAEALAEIKAGVDFSVVAEKYSTSTYPGDEELVNNTSSIPSVVVEFIDYLTTPTLSEVLTDGTTNYIVQVTNADTNKLKDEIIESFTFDSTFTDKTLESFFVKYNFTIYDKSVYDLFIQTYPNYITK
ncbi:MAG: peptidylprolyl isomerase [Erysipelotrichaceae bacterium]